MRLNFDLFHTLRNNRILGNVSWLFLDQAVRMTAGVFVTIWVARYLGPREFGLLNYAVAYVALFGFLANLGLDSLLVRELVRHPTDAPTLVGTALLLKLCGACAVGVFCISSQAIIGSTENELLPLIAIVALSGILNSSSVLGLHFQARETQKYLVWSNNAGFAVYVVLRLSFVGAGAGVLLFGWALCAQTLVNMIVLWVLYRKHCLALKRLTFSTQKAKELLRESWPQMLAALSINIYMRIDQIMLANMAGATETGIYSAAVRLSEIWYFLPAIIVPAIFPSIVRSKAEGRAAVDRKMLRLFSFMTCLSTLVAIPMGFAAKPIVGLIYGGQYVDAGTILQIHIWSSLFIFWGMAQEPWNVSEGLLKLSLFRTIGGAVINVLLNIYLIPRYGGMGAAVATVISQASATLIGNFCFTATRPIALLQLRSFLFVKYLAK